MKHLPLYHAFAGRRCLVVGGGRVAGRRVARVVDAGGVVDVVAIEAGDDIQSRAEKSGGEVNLRAYQSADLDARAYQLVVAATDNRAVNRQVASDAKRRGVAVNVADDAKLCDVVFPLAIDRGPIIISVASGAASPTLTRMLGARIQSLVPAGYGELARLVSKYRKAAKAKIPDTGARIKFWEDALQGVVAESVFSGDAVQAERLLAQALESPREQSDDKSKTGEVYLIGAGPGDPDLLTLRAYRLLQQADVVLYDRLVGPEILRMLPADAEQIYVGKRRARHPHPQVGINRMLSDYARAGMRVARLKGGDPFIFGRGGEEIAHLADEGVAFQVIPGITAANGCACYAGIPLTHRDHAQSVRFVTGQLRDGGVDLDWPSLVAPGQTLVFYMSLRGLPVICERLLAHGVSPKLPVALVEKGSTPQQRVYVSTLGNMRAKLTRITPRPPTLFIAGEVVALRGKLDWFRGQAQPAKA